jgi:hypothetical protein
VSNLVLVIVCLLLGLALQRAKKFPTGAATSLNAYVIYIALPALILQEIPKLALNSQALLPIVSAWVIMAITAALVLLVCRYQHWSKEVTGALLLTVPLGNTSFVGLPLIDALLGPSAIPYAILYDQFGTFIALNTAGITIAGIYAKHSSSHTPHAHTSIWKNIVTFPPFIALVAAIMLRWVDYPLWFNELLPRLSSTLVPVVMVAVGLQWRLRLAREDLTPLVAALSCLLIITPAIAWLLMAAIGAQGLVANTIILEAAMPAMISAGVLAMSYNLAPRLSAAIVGYGIMLALVTVPAWKYLLTL